MGRLPVIGHMVATSLAMTAAAHPPDCPVDRSGDYCRQYAIHAEHPRRSECAGEEGAAREACLAEAAKGGGHPAIWECAPSPAGNHCRYLVSSGAALAYQIVDGIGENSCGKIWAARGALLAAADPEEPLFYFIRGLTEAVYRDQCPHELRPVAVSR